MAAQGVGVDSAKLVKTSLIAPFCGIFQVRLRGLVQFGVRCAWEPAVADKEQQVEETPKKRGVVSRALLAVALLALAGGAFRFFSRRHSAQASVEAKDNDSVKSVLHLESFVVNLADPDQTAFLRIGIDLGLAQSGSAEKPPDKNSPVLPKVRDAILSVLTTWQSVALLAPEGKAKLKQQLLSALHEQVSEVPVKEIYFTEFLVQR